VNASPLRCCACITRAGTPPARSPIGRYGSSAFAVPSLGAALARSAISLSSSDCDGAQAAGPRSPALLQSKPPSCLCRCTRGAPRLGVARATAGPQRLHPSRDAIGRLLWPPYISAAAVSCALTKGQQASSGCCGHRISVLPPSVVLLPKASSAPPEGQQAGEVIFFLQFALNFFRVCADAGPAAGCAVLGRKQGADAVYRPAAFCEHLLPDSCPRFWLC